MYGNTQFCTKPQSTFRTKKVDSSLLIRLHWSIQNSSCTFNVPMFFSRRGHNVWIFVLFSSWKGKSSYIKWYFMKCFLYLQIDIKFSGWFNSVTTQTRSCLNYPSALLYGFLAFDHTFIGFRTASRAFFLVKSYELILNGRVFHQEMSVQYRFNVYFLPGFIKAMHWPQIIATFQIF